MYFFQLIYPSLGFQQWARACVSLMCEVSPSSSALESNWLNAPWPWGFVEFGIEHNETWHCFAISPPFTSISGMKGHKDEGLLDPWKCLRPKWQDHRSVRKADEGDSRGWDMVLRLYCRIVLHSFWGSYNFGQYPNDLASPYKLGSQAVIPVITDWDKIVIAYAPCQQVSGGFSGEQETESPEVKNMQMSVAFQ